MKRIISIILMVVMLGSLCACETPSHITPEEKVEMVVKAEIEKDVTETNDEANDFYYRINTVKQNNDGTWSAYGVFTYFTTVYGTTRQQCNFEALVSENAGYVISLDY